MVCSRFLLISQVHNQFYIQDAVLQSSLLGNQHFLYLLLLLTINIQQLPIEK